MENNNNESIPEAQVEAMIQKMTLIFFAIIAGIIVFAGVAFYLVALAGREVSPELDETFKIVVPLLAVGGAFASRFIYSLLLKKAANRKEPTQRISGYQTAILIRLALLEGPCLFAIVSFFS